MRWGVMGVGITLFLLFLVFINTSDISEEKVDSLFEGIDANISGENFSNDSNFSKFFKYTARGIVHEFHGTYYLAAALSPSLPRWLVDNAELLTVLAILVLAAPIIAVVVKFGLLIALALFMLVWEQIKKWRSKDGKEKG